MTSDEWGELASENTSENRRDELLEKTAMETEHPDGYVGPCACQLCMSYGE